MMHCIVRVIPLFNRTFRGLYLTEGKPMSTMKLFRTIALSGLVLLVTVSAASGQKAVRDQALDAMKKAAVFYHDRVSTRGGYLMEYTADLNVRFGELPARESQIWVQNPSTPGVGETFLAAFRATGDSLYLKYACDAGRALVWGQMDCGGWNYLIDFKPGSLETWYEGIKVHTDYDEFMHFNGNATFDDGVTADATLLLPHLYDATLDPAWLPPLQKALDFTLRAQYPIGAWPQRFPLVGTGYDVLYTFNDGVTAGNIDLMCEAWRLLADPRYLESARRGADFIIASQHAGPQYGWGQQISRDMKLTKARVYEPASLSTSDTMDNLDCLMDMYEFTGDRRYLEPVPRALDWLDSSVLPDGGIGTFLEEGTNRALAAKFVGDSGTPESVAITYNLAEAMGGYGFQRANFTTKPTRSRYTALKNTVWAPPVPPAKPSREAALKRAADLEKDIRNIFGNLDSQGRWTEDGRMYTKRYCFKNDMEYEGPVLKNGWVRTGTFIRNMGRLIEYVSLTGQ
jgi:PelA/Pel-15E family pectate lyase